MQSQTAIVLSQSASKYQFNFVRTSGSEYLRRTDGAFHGPRTQTKVTDCVTDTGLQAMLAGSGVSTLCHSVVIHVGQIKCLPHLQVIRLQPPFFSM